MSKKTPPAKNASASIKKSKPDLICKTNTTPGSVIDVKVAVPVTVTYRFFSAHASALIHQAEGVTASQNSMKLTGLPIVFGYVENLKIDSCSGEKLLLLPNPISMSIMPKGKAANPKTPRKAITVDYHLMPIKEVRSGKAFGLLLGVDTKSNFREYPLYQVTPKDRDVIVDVYETYGKHTGNDTPAFIETREVNGNKVDFYEAKLTGDIWKKISHAYDSSDVDEMLDVDLPDEAIQAIKDIYDGKLKGSNGRYSLDADVGNNQKIKFVWGGGNENALGNISSLDIKAELLTRVQPNTYGALLKAAIDAQVDEVTITSGWRPMLGSVFHRLGLGLDVTYVKHDGKNHHMYRNRGTLSQDEKDAYKDVADKQKALDAANKAKKSQKEIGPLEEELVTAKIKLAKVIDTAQPKPVKDFRKTLLGLAKIKQVLDPWYLDTNAGDTIEPQVNMLGQGKTKDRALEENHSHHLHITATDSELGVVRSKK